MICWLIVCARRFLKDDDAADAASADADGVVYVVIAASLDSPYPSASFVEINENVVSVYPEVDI